LNSGQINPSAKKLIRFRRKKRYYIRNGLIKLNQGIHALAQAITLVESNKPEDRVLAIQLLKACNPVSNKTIRIGHYRPPGVGKSSFIESLGILILEDAPVKIAVLSVDPSSLCRWEYFRRQNQNADTFCT
jgi:LAO/AO transport system kinase